MKVFRFLINLLLIAGIGYVSYLLYESIRGPIEFDTKRKVIDDATINKLKKVRSAQLAYKASNAYFADNFDSLKHFILTDSFQVIKRIGDPNDSTVAVKTEILKMAVIDSLYKNAKSEVDTMERVPVGSITEDDDYLDFEIMAGIVTKNEVDIPAFQVYVPYKELYQKLDANYSRQYIEDLRDTYMSVGDIREASTSGNWER